MIRKFFNIKTYTTQEKKRMMQKHNKVIVKPLTKDEKERDAEFRNLSKKEQEEEIFKLSMRLLYGED